ncbi:MAG: GTP-binding protein [Deltaproteobacteria bacterium RIFOXYD12_FULL_57_12]|nr:MAG: GTP-binding protein [Deltaproteobacteria bacterium RIFOXYD12_FULL_57_12]
MKIGIIGLPGAGKTTIFEAITRIVPTESLPRMEDRLGTIRVPDKRIDALSALYKPRKTIYTQIEYLLPRAAIYAQGQKKDETLWTGVRSCDALLHVVRNFVDASGGAPDSAGDFARLDQEMIFADLLVVEKRLERLTVDQKRGRKIDGEEEKLLIECRTLLEQDTPLRRSPELAAARLLKGFTFLSAKPILVVFSNDDESEAAPAVPELLAHENCITVRGRLEHELARMSEEDAREYLQEYGITTSVVDRVIAVSYQILGLISFFTVGEDEVRAWTIEKNTQAVDAAEVIHSDIKKGFIRAEVIAYDDLMTAGSTKEAKKKGTSRLEGKTYLVQDGDIIEFRFNV